MLARGIAKCEMGQRAATFSEVTAERARSRNYGLGRKSVGAVARASSTRPHKFARTLIVVVVSRRVEISSVA